jgi:hypothetical protein
MGQNWSTVVAAALVVVMQRPSFCAILPLGATGAVFNMILELMKVSSLKGEALITASVVLITNVGKAFTGTMAIVSGLGTGIAIICILKRE